MKQLVLDAAGQWISVADLPEVARLIEAARGAVSDPQPPTDVVLMELDAAIEALRS